MAAEDSKSLESMNSQSLPFSENGWDETPEVSIVGVATRSNSSSSLKRSSTYRRRESEDRGSALKRYATKSPYDEARSLVAETDIQGNELVLGSKSTGTKIFKRTAVEGTQKEEGPTLITGVPSLSHNATDLSWTNPGKIHDPQVASIEQSFLSVNGSLHSLSLTTQSSLRRSEERHGSAVHVSPLPSRVVSPVSRRAFATEDNASSTARHSIEILPASGNPKDKLQKRYDKLKIQLKKSHFIVWQKPGTSDHHPWFSCVFVTPDTNDVFLSGELISLRDDDSPHIYEDGIHWYGTKKKAIDAASGKAMDTFYLQEKGKSAKYRLQYCIEADKQVDNESLRNLPQEVLLDIEELKNPLL